MTNGLSQIAPSKGELHHCNKSVLQPSCNWTPGSASVHLGAAKISAVIVAEGEESHGTPILSEPCVWSSRGYRSLCCDRERCAATADFGGTKPGAAACCRRGARRRGAGRGQSSQARTGPLAPPPPLASSPLAPPPLASLASSPLAPPPLAPPSLAPSPVKSRVPETVASGGGDSGTGPCLSALVGDVAGNYLARKPSISLLNSSGFSRNTRCPASGITSAFAWIILAASSVASSAF